MFSTQMFALASTLSFAIGAHAFFTFGQKVNYLWVNLFKTFLALITFGIIFAFKGSFNIPDLTSFAQFFFSGFLGLGLADIFLIKAFLILRPGRTLTITSFQPMIVGFLSFILLGHSFAWEKLYGIICFIICSVILSFDGPKHQRSHTLKGIGYSMLGLMLNSFSCILTRMACDQSPLVDSIEGNFIRLLGALVCFLIFKKFIFPTKFSGVFSTFKTKEKITLISGCLFAAVLSLFFYILAIKNGDLATVTAIGLSLPLFSLLIEVLVEKRTPTRPMMISLFFFTFGIILVV